MPGPAIYGAAVTSPQGAFARSAVRRYGIAICCAIAGAVVRYAFNPVLHHLVPWLFFFPAVLCAAMYGRFGAGMVATAASVLLAFLLWMPPLVTLSHSGIGMWIGAGGFIAGSMLICFVAEQSHRATRDLELERKFLDAVLSSITDGLMVIDRDWRIVFINTAAEGLCHERKQDVLGRSVWEVLPHLRGTNFEKELQRSRDEQTPVHFEVPGRIQDRWLEFRAHPMDGSTAIYISDISPRKKAEIDLTGTQTQLVEYASNLEDLVRDRTAELQHTVTKLEETVAELEQYSYTISHDLRAPLRAMQSFAMFIAEDYGSKLDSRGRNYLDRIQAAAQRMDRLINDVLVYTRTARERVNLAPMEIDKLVEDLVTQYTPEASARTIVRHPLARVVGNEALLTQAISNLLVNAAKFVPPGEPPKIEIWSERHDGHIRLSVRDRGIGIPEEAREKVFGIFQRAHSSTYPGTGIGLAIVKRAVERMNGSVGFESEVGGGSTFWIELPAG